MQKQHPTFGKYKILNELGRGGMGVVYKAYDTKLQSYVALKMILNKEREHLQRFFAETTAIAKLNHANIVRFYEYGEVPYPYFTMEYIEGCTLAELIKQKSITAAQLVDILIPICDALYYSHRNEIMHRDIKPSNIMITKSGVAKIMDFGLAKTENKTQLSKSGQMLGTVAYMAPEQVEGRATYQSDIYSLGATMYEALTFRTVFQGAIDLNIIMQIMENPPLNLRQLNPDISPYLEAICLKCLQKNPRKRYESFKQLSKEFANYKAHRPIIARRYSSWDVLTNFIRKHKVIFSSVVVIFAMLTISLVVTLQALSFAEEEKRKTKTALNKTMKVIEYSLNQYNELKEDKQFASLCGNIFEDLELYGENQDWSFIKGYIANVRGNFLKSLEYYNKEIHQNPTNAFAYNNRGIIYQKMKEHEKALNDYNNAIFLTPKFYSAYMNRGILYQEMKNYPKALENYTAGISIDPNNWEAYTNRGKLYRDMGDNERAINDLNKAISINPNSPKAYTNRGVLYRDMKEYQKALTDFNKAIFIDPKYGRIYINRGFLYYEIKEYQKALSDYQKAISINSQYFEVYANRGILYHDMKEYQKALADFNKAISINSLYSIAYTNRGSLYHDMKEHQKALMDFNKAISINPHYFEAYANRSILYNYMEKYDKALIDCNRAISINPHSPSVYHSRGLLYQRMTKYEKALNDYNKVIFMNSKHYKTYINRGATYYSLKKYHLAIKDFKQVLSIYPKKAHRGLYFAYKTLGNKNKADYHFLQMKKYK